MEAPIVGGNTGGLPLSGQAARREWRKVSEMSNGHGRIVANGPGNQSRTHHSGRPRSGNVGLRRTNQNGRMFHPRSSEHSSDSDHQGGDDSGGQLRGDPLSLQEMANLNIGQQGALHEELHREQQSEHASMKIIPMGPGFSAIDNPEDGLEQQLLDVSRKREQLQQAELELRAQFIARSEVHRMQKNYEEQFKQHAEIVASLQNEIHDRDQRMHCLDQNLEEREQELRANQIQANEAVSPFSHTKNVEHAQRFHKLHITKCTFRNRCFPWDQVWAKDGLLREQTNELASLRRERDTTLAEQKAALAQLEAGRSDYAAQVEHLKEQLHEKVRRRQEVEEQNHATQELLLFKDGQLQDAQAWMARAQELDAYHVNANQTLQAELRDRSEQLNQVWMGYQRQLTDMERFHAQVVQRLQTELNEAREQAQMLQGSGQERLGTREERQLHVGNHTDIQREGNEESLGKATMKNSAGVVRGNPILVTHGNVEAAVPVYIPLDNSIKGDHATGLPVVQFPAVIGITPVMSSSGVPMMQQFSLQQQPVTPASWASPGLQSSHTQLHVHPNLLSTPLHPSAHQQVGNAHHQNAQLQQQTTQLPHLSLPSSLLPNQNMQSSQPQHQVLDREDSRQHGGILLSQLSLKAQAPSTPVQPTVQTGQQESLVIDSVQPLSEGLKLPHSSQDQQQVEIPMQHHRNNNRQEQQQHPQSHQSVQEQHSKPFSKQDPVQEHETRQLQHQQGISSSMHHLSQPTAPMAEENLVQHKPSPRKSIMAKQEPRQPVTNQSNSQQGAPEPIKNPEPVLLDERSLLACLMRAVPAEANAKISMKSTLPDRLGKMLAPLHWQSYRKQYGRLDEFVSLHKEHFVIEGDYIYLSEGVHDKVSATTAVAKGAAGAAAASPVGLDRLPSVAVTSVAQASQLQRGNPTKGFSKDVRPQPLRDESIIHTQGSISPHQPKSNTQDNSTSLLSRNSVGNGVASSNNLGELDGANSTSVGEFSSNNLSVRNNSGGMDNGEANSFGNSRAGGGYHGSRHQNRVEAGY
ncbi:uncharacterized protein [Physcomitrium patens]|uniref:uncharacterized protein isoform X4 n=1 Tax=Physcomitrium patens TaxID=3218 RepID=UPI003CCD2961